MKFKTYCLFSLSTLAILSPIYSYGGINIKDYIQYLPYGTNVSLLVESTNTQNRIMAFNDQRMMLPASTQKVVTALSALLILGPEYRFMTTLESSGKVQNSLLNGDIIVRFNGDPTLTKKQLVTLFGTLSAKGVKAISGDLVIDSSVFSSHDKAMGWSWNNISSCYNTPPAAAIIDSNCFYASLSPAKKIADRASVALKERYPVNVSSDVMTIPAKNNNRYCELDAIIKDNNRYILKGCVKQGKNIPLSFSILDSDVYARDVIKDILAAQNIKLKGSIKINTPIHKALTVIATQQSEPLSVLLSTMLKTSSNLIADTIFRTMGREYFGVGTWRSGSDAVKKVLKEKADIDLASAVIVDGSGLSRQDGITAEKMMEVLQYIAKNDAQLNLIKMLPISGKDGTLASRTSLNNKELTGHIQAKTGYLDGSYNLAGFMTTKNGNKLAFVQFISGYSVTTVSRAEKKSIVNFEKALYSDLYLQ